VEDEFVCQVESYEEKLLMKIWAESPAGLREKMGMVDELKI